MPSLSSGLEYTTKEVERITGINGIVRWIIESKEQLTVPEIEEAIEKERPFAGYGASKYSRITNLVTLVKSNASCD